MFKPFGVLQVEPLPVGEELDAPVVAANGEGGGLDELVGLDILVEAVCSDL